MQLITQASWDPSAPCDAVVLALHDQWKSDPAFLQVDQALNGWLSTQIQADEVSFKTGKTSLLLLPSGPNFRILVTVGLGDRTKADSAAWFRAAGSATKTLASKIRSRITFLGFPTDVTPDPLLAAMLGAMNGMVGQGLFKREPPLHLAQELVWLQASPTIAAKAMHIGESMLFARYLVNLPANQLDPIEFVTHCRIVMKSLPIDVEEWDQARLEKEKCGALLAVARGSSKPPRLLKLRYVGDPSKPLVALVGKGVTFDSGGLSIKPSDSMITMKCDMAGGATVAAILLAAAKLQLPCNLIGLVGLVENMVDGDSFRLGDVLTARSGKTIEIHNTDAEGRLVLADTLNVALDHQPAHIVDFATLTGACVVALGNDISGLMSNSPPLATAIQQSAERCGEYVWPLPMHRFFSDQIAGKIADIKNVGEGRWGGAITAAKFLEEFVDGKPWAHLDIAGPAFYDSPRAWQDAGGTATLVRTLLDWLQTEIPKA